MNLGKRPRMGRFNLMHYLPGPRLHGLNGYKEVIDTIGWGLKDLGHAVSYSVNQIDVEARNIIFGAQLLSVDVLQTLPANTIVFNMEQYHSAVNRDTRADPEFANLQFIGQNFEIWDFDKANLSCWEALNSRNVKIVPISYAPILRRIEKPAIQDIDVLIYGLAGPARLTAFHRLSNAGLVAVFVSGLYGNARDALICRSKLILNATLYHRGFFEIVRVSYLLANQKAVVCVVESGTRIDQGLEDCLKFTSIENLVATCTELLENEAERVRMELRGFEEFSTRDIRPVLQRAAG